jgi:outer membrane receptor protein involved in Fe transport
VVLSGTKRNLDSLLIASLYRTGGYRDNSGEARGTLFLKESLRRGDSIYSVRVMHHRADWDAAGFLALPKLYAGTVQPTDRDTSTPEIGGDAQRTSVVLMRDRADNVPSWHATLYMERYGRARSTGANSTDIDWQKDLRWISGGRLTRDFVFGDRLAATIGGETRSDLGDAVSRRWSSGQPTAKYGLYQDLNLLSYGAFAQLQYKPVQTLKLVGGLRADGFRYHIDNLKSPAASVEYNKGVAAPKLGLVWSAHKRLDFFANAGEGFRSPDQSEISPSGAIGALGAGTTVANATLVPSKVRSYDWGFESLLCRRWSFNAAGFYTLNKDEISQTASYVFSSIGNTTRIGWESEIRYAHSDAWMFYANYTQINRARINSAAAGAADALSVPRHLPKIGAAYQRQLRGQDRLEVNLDYAYSSGLPYFAGSPLKLGYSRPYSRYDMRANYEHGSVYLVASAILQPHRFSGEALYGSSAGLMLDPRPKVQFGLTLGYRF